MGVVGDGGGSTPDFLTTSPGLSPGFEIENMKQTAVIFPFIFKY